MVEFVVMWRSLHTRQATTLLAEQLCFITFPCLWSYCPSCPLINISHSAFCTFCLSVFPCRGPQEHQAVLEKETSLYTSAYACERFFFWLLFYCLIAQAAAHSSCRVCRGGLWGVCETHTLMSSCPLKASCIHHAFQENEIKAVLQMEKSLLIKNYLNCSPGLWLLHHFLGIEQI